MQVTKLRPSTTENRNMKVIISLLSLVAVVFGGVVTDLCPPEQIEDWTIEKLLPHEECGKFYQCTHGRPVERICPDGLHFNVEENICDWPHLANCTEKEDGGFEVVPASPDDKQEIQMSNALLEDLSSEEPNATEPVPIFGPNGCPIDPFVHWLLPHETECNKFYSCAWGDKVEMQCLSPDTHFNPEIQVCDWPSDAGCELASYNK